MGQGNTCGDGWDEVGDRLVFMFPGLGEYVLKEELAHREGQTRELVILYLSPRFFTLLVLAGDAPTAL
jgi:hypothetical protein